MTEFEKEINPIIHWIENKLKGRLPYSDIMTIPFCAALINEYAKEQLDNNIRSLLIEFVTEIMTNKKYYELENIAIVDEYIKSNL